MIAVYCLPILLRMKKRNVFNEITILGSLPTYYTKGYTQPPNISKLYIASVLVCEGARLCVCVCVCVRARARARALELLLLLLGTEESIGTNVYFITVPRFSLRVFHTVLLRTGCPNHWNLLSSCSNSVRLKGR